MSSEETLGPAATATLSDAEFQALVRRHAPSYWRERELHDALRLDAAGLGFDSIGLVELLVACERELALPLPPDLLLDTGMTLGDLKAKLAEALAAARG